IFSATLVHVGATQGQAGPQQRVFDLCPDRSRTRILRRTLAFIRRRTLLCILQEEAVRGNMQNAGCGDPLEGALGGPRSGKYVCVRKKPLNGAGLLCGAAERSKVNV